MEFVASLQEEFPNKPDLTKVIAKLARYGQPLLKIVPYAGEVAHVIADDILTMAERRPAWHSTYKELSQEFAKLHQRVLVVVDDVDRLSTDELQSLLRVVRLLGRFNNVHYLLAYDHDSVEQTLELAGIARISSSFMEKIVQHPFEVPPVSRVVRRQWCRNLLKNLESQAQASDTHFNHIGTDREDLISVLAEVLWTPRAVSRLEEQLQNLWPLAIQAEIDPLDYVAITWLRISHHRLWEDIRQNYEVYRASTSTSAGHSLSQLNDRMNERVADPATQVSVRKIVEFLFDAGPVPVFGPRTRNRLQTPRYFERYFHISISSADISDRMLDQAMLDLASDNEATPDVEALTQMITGDDHELALDAIDLIFKRRRLATGTTPATLRFAASITSTIGGTPSSTRDSFERWALCETYRAHATGLLPAESLCDLVGTAAFIKSAYAGVNVLRAAPVAVRDMYRVPVASWEESLSELSTHDVIHSSRLREWSSLADWLEYRNADQPRLPTHSLSYDELLAAAERFITFEEWRGDYTAFDTKFDAKGFSFLVGPTNSLSHFCRELEGSPSALEFDVDHLATATLPPEQLRAYAEFSLRTLYVASNSATEE